MSDLQPAFDESTEIPWYFKDGQGDGLIQPDTGNEGPDDCKACTKELVKLGLREKPDA